MNWAFVCAREGRLPMKNTVQQSTQETRSWGQLLPEEVWQGKLGKSSQFLQGLLDTPRILLSREQVLWLPGDSTGLEIPEGQGEICAHLFHPSESSFLDPPDQPTHWTNTCRSDPGNTGFILEREAFVSLTSTGAESFIFSLQGLLVHSKCSITITKEKKMNSCLKQLNLMMRTSVNRKPWHLLRILTPHNVLSHTFLHLSLVTPR